MLIAKSVKNDKKYKVFNIKSKKEIKKIIYVPEKNRVRFRDIKKLKEIINKILDGKISKLKEFQKFKKIKPKSIDDIYKLRDYVSLKLTRISI